MWGGLIHWWRTARVVVGGIIISRTLTCNQMPELSVLLMLWPFNVYVWTLSFVLILHKNSGCSMSTCADI